jgi:O-antigen ligase
MLVGAAWLLWAFSAGPARVPQRIWGRVAIPAVLALTALVWAVIQTLPGLSSSATAFVWREAAAILDPGLSPHITLDPWRSVTEIMKLGMYAMMACLAFAFARQPERAHHLLSILIAIGAAYALYALALDVRGDVQFEFFYPGTPIGNEGAGPFVNRNSYATFAGLILICAMARLADAASLCISVSNGMRRFLLSIAQFSVGPGMGALLTFLIALSTLVASGSRAGFVSALVGLAILFLFAATIGARRLTLWQGVATGALFLAAGVGVLVLSGDQLVQGLDRLAESGGALELRGTLWEAASRMIREAPGTGLGLGTYEYAYPMHAADFQRVTMDKAHNDYLELAAGLGLPAALLWLGALAWLTGLCVRGLFVRRRDRVYPLIAIGATALVGFHSIFDFSLQIPAIALFYAALLGLGVAQSFSSRDA